MQEFITLIEDRNKSAGLVEDSYQILVTAEQGNRLRAYVNAEGKRKNSWKENYYRKITIARKSVPNQLFS